MLEIVYLNNYLEEPYTTSEVIAEWTDNKHESVTRLIRTHKESLETFGKVGKQIRPLPSGQSTKIYLLNEQQVTLLIAFMQNTPEVIQFKVELVKQFYKMKEEIQAFKVQRAIEQPTRKNLTDAIKEWEHASPWAYKHITDLLLKLVTGKNAKQIREEHHTPTALDGLSAKNLLELEQLEQITIPLIEMGLNYQELKQKLVGVIECYTKVTE